MRRGPCAGSPIRVSGGRLLLTASVETPPQLADAQLGLPQPLLGAGRQPQRRAGAADALFEGQVSGLQRLDDSLQLRDELVEGARRKVVGGWLICHGRRPSLPGG